MSILKLLQDSQNGEGLARLADQLGLDRDQANGLAGMLAPALGTAARKRADKGSLDSVLGALKGEGNAVLYDDPTRAAAPEGQAQGMDFLKTLRGGEGEARELADEAAGRAGLDVSVVQQFLPALAAMIQGGLQKRMPDRDIDSALERIGGGGGGLGGLLGGALQGMIGGGGRQSGGQAGGLNLGVLGDLLDADGDGSPLDDVLERFIK